MEPIPVNVTPGPMGKSIAVLGTCDPSRNLAISVLLRECIERHGWGQRLGVTAAGYADGAGRARSDALRALAESGVRPSSDCCPDIEIDTAPISSADCLVVGTDEEADLFLTWPEASGKPVFTLSDFLGTESWAVDDPAAELGSFLAQVNEAVPLLLRSIIAGGL